MMLNGELAVFKSHCGNIYIRLSIPLVFINKRLTFKLYLSTKPIIKTGAISKDEAFSNEEDKSSEAPIFKKKENNENA